MRTAAILAVSMLGLGACGRLGFNAGAAADSAIIADSASDSGRLDAGVAPVLVDAVLVPDANLVCGTQGDAVAFYPAGFSCYYRFDTPKTWAEAEAVCVTLGFGGHLVSIADQGELEFVHQFSNGESWLGATDQDNEGTFTWSNGAPFGFTYWASGEPNNFEGSEDCAYAYGLGQWNDISCLAQLSFICQVPMTA